MKIDTLMSSLPPEPRAFPFRAPGPVLTYTLQATHSVSSEIILRSFVSVPWGHVVFLATLACTNGGCGQEEATIATRLLFVVSKHLASRPCVLFVHLQIRLRLGSRNRGRRRCTFSPVVSACIETMGEVTPGCTERALCCHHLLSHWTLGPTHTCLTSCLQSAELGSCPRVTPLLTLSLRPWTGHSLSFSLSFLVNKMRELGKTTSPMPENGARKL